MADIKLFRVGQKVEELKSSAVEMEKKLQAIGHYGTGNVELRLQSVADFEKAKPFLRRAYDEN